MSAKMTQAEAEAFAEAVGRGEYGRCVPLEQARAIYQDGFAAGWAQGQARLRERAVDFLLQHGFKIMGGNIAVLPLEPSPGCPMPEREEPEP